MGFERPNSVVIRKIVHFNENICVISKIIVILFNEKIKKQAVRNVSFSNDWINDDDGVFNFSLLCAS